MGAKDRNILEHKNRGALGNESLKNTIKIASVYAGTILGAGFASGREITQYFVGFGNKGFLGLILAGLMFGLVGWAVMDITYKNNIKSYKEFLDRILGNVCGSIMEWVSIVFMFVIFATMLSAGGAVAEQSKDVSHTIVILIFSIICAITLMFDIKAIIMVNSIISPVLLIGGICLGLYAFLQKTIPTSVNVLILKQNFIFSSVIYVSYNIITAVSVLSSLGGLVNAKKVARYGGLAGGLSLGVMGIFLGLGIIVNYKEVANLEIPILQIAASIGVTIGGIYVVMLIMAIYTTAIINGYAVMTWALKKFKIKKSLFIPLFIISGFIASGVRFSDFVGAVYPLFGYIGIFEILVILMHFLIPRTLQS